MSPTRLAAEQRAAERAQADAERLAAINRLRVTLDELVTVHRDSWPEATPPVVRRMVIVDESAVIKHVRAHCLQGVGFLQRQHRREAVERADTLTARYIQEENDRLDRVRREVQAKADQWWRDLLANDEQVVCEALNAAFADNPAGGAAVGVRAATASVVIRQLDLGTMPTHRPDVTAAGKPTMRKLNQRDRHSLFLDSLVSNVAATLRESFAVAPGLAAITVCALVRFERTQQLGPVLLGRWERQAFEAVAWAAPGDAHELVLDRAAELHLDRAASGEARPLSSRTLPGLDELMRSVLDSGDQDEEAADESDQASPLRPRSFEEWLAAQDGAAGPTGQPAPPGPEPHAEGALRPGQVAPLGVTDSEGHVRLTVQADWTAPEVDISVLMLDQHQQTRSDNDFIFYNNPTSPSGAVRLEPPALADGVRTQVVTVDVKDLRRDGVERLAVVISSDEPLTGRADVQAAMTVGQGQAWRLPLPAESGVAAAVVCEIYLRRTAQLSEWRVRGLGQGWQDGLAGVVRNYGVQVSD